MYYIDCFCFNFNVFYICIEPGDHILSNYRHKITKYAYLNEFYSAIVDRFLFTNMKTRRLQHSTTAHE